MIGRQEALEYHSRDPRGKVEVVPTKPCLTQRDLSLAYTPGVAVPCKEIEARPEDAYRYTSKGNLVAVISNGTAVLGLGDIGALAGKPVMEGKGVLFKRFADIDVFDIEVDTHDPEEMIKFCKLIEPTFGGINLEDIKAPECFQIEDTLKEHLNIPVFHDDQHGTAIISGAGLLNALELVGKEIGDVRVVFNGAGASGIACARFYISLGVKPENLVLCDSRGVVYKGREKGMNPWKSELANDTDARSLADAFVGSDVFVGVSVADTVTAEMVKSMADKPIIFAMANPDPEIPYDVAKAARPDAIIATGRSDYPNQVNNVLGFPFIFRGALDVRATTINEEMKRAAARALAQLTKEDVPDSVLKAYGLDKLHFGPEYIIPKPFDPRVLIWEASAVAQAAMETSVAQRKVDLDEYREELERRLGKSHQVMRIMINEARRDPKRVVFPEGANDKVLRAAQVILDEGFAHPVLLGDKSKILEKIEELDLHLAQAEIVDLGSWGKREEYAQALYRMRQRKGVTVKDARRMLENPVVCGAMMVEMGAADAILAGVGKHYPEALRPALQVLHTRKDFHKVAGLYMVILKDEIYFFADTTVNINPTAEDLAEIAIMSAEVAQRFHVEPRVAMLSFSNFGSSRHPESNKVAKAVRILKERKPDMIVDGEMQADTAVCPEIVNEAFPFCDLKNGANVLIFPDLNSANIAYKLLQRLGGAECVGPILMGVKKPMHLMQTAAEVKDIVHLAAIASIDAQKAHADR